MKEKLQTSEPAFESDKDLGDFRNGAEDQKDVRPEGYDINSEEILGGFLSDAEEQGMIKDRELGLPESQLAKIKNEMLEKLRDGNFLLMEKIQKDSGVSEGIYKLPEMQQAARETMLVAVKEGSVELLCQIRDKFGIPTSIREEPEFLEAAKQTMREYFLESLIIGDDSYVSAREIQEIFGIPEAEIERNCELTDEVRSTIIYKINQGEFGDIAELRSALLDLKEVYDNQLIREAANKRLAELFKSSLLSKAYNDSGQYVNFMSEEGLDEIYLLKNKFNLDISQFIEEEYLNCARNTLDHFKRGGYVEAIPVAKVRDIFSFSKEIIDAADEMIKDPNITYGFSRIKTILEKNNYSADNDLVFRIIPKIGQDWPALGQTLRYYKLDEIERKLDQGARLVDIWQAAGREKLLQRELDHFKDVFVYLGDSIESVDEKKIARFESIKDNRRRLSELGGMNPAEACECIKRFGLNGGAYDYLSKRLSFYKDVISGNGLRKEYQDGKFNPIKNRTDKILKIEQIDPSTIDQESINSGLLRDIYYAAMQGTPEMAAVKIATKNVNRGNVANEGGKRIRSVIEFWGYHSGICNLPTGISIGQYEPLIELYHNCRKQIEKEYSIQGLDSSQIEHKAVLFAAARLEGAYSYCGLLQKSASPHVPGFDEAIIAGRLGGKVMRQMAGMRKKIPGTKFEHIDRFIGKSGDNKYGREKRGLETAIDYLKGNVREEDRMRMVEEDNNHDIDRLERNYKQTVEQSKYKSDKAKREIQELDIPLDEKELQLKNLEQRNLEQTEIAKQAYEEKLKYLQNRTSEQLLADLAVRKEIVDRRFEKRKSLAQKAIDLHFHFNHEARESREPKIFKDTVDWINNAPFGVIKRAHRALVRGIDDQAVIMMVLAEILNKGKKETEVRDFTVDDLISYMIKSGKIGELVQSFDKIKGIDKNKHYQIVKEIIKVGSGWTLPDNFEKFTGIDPHDHLEIALLLIDSNAGYGLVKNFDKFFGIPQNEHLDIVLNLIKKREGFMTVRDLGRFTGIRESDHNAIALELMKSGEIINMGNYNREFILNKLKGLDESLRPMISDEKWQFLSQALNAGFNLDEIKRFPFLASSLVGK